MPPLGGLIYEGIPENLRGPEPAERCEASTQHNLMSVGGYPVGLLEIG